MTSKHFLVVLAALIAPVALTFGAAPPNDLFADRIALVGTNLTFSGTCRGATTESWEPDRGIPGASVWWSWTAPADGTVALEAVGGNAWARVFALEGDSVESLANIAGLREWRYPARRSSRIAFPVSRGIVYNLVVGVVDVLPGGGTDFTLEVTWRPRPPNDAFGDRFVLSGSEITERVQVAGATAEAWEAGHRAWFYDVASSSWLSPLTAWWEWRAPASGPVTVALDAEPGTMRGFAASGNPEDSVAVTVLEGRDPTQSELVGAAIGVAPPHVATVRFEAVAGTTYQLALQGTTFPNDPHTLRIRYGQPPRIVVTQPLNGSEWRVGETVPLKAYAVSPDGTVRKVEFYLAQNYDEFAAVTIAQQSPFEVNWTPAQAGQYRVMAVAVDDRDVSTVAMPITIQIRPSNDTFANRTPIKDMGVDTVGDLANASAEAPLLGGADIWWTWTPPSHGAFSIEARCESGYWPQLEVFTGSDVDRLVRIASNTFAGTDNTYMARVTFEAEAGRGYALRVCANAFQTRCPVTLHIVKSAPPAASLLEPQNGDWFTNGIPVSLSATATDPDDGVARVEFLLDDHVVATAMEPPYEVTIPSQPGPAGYSYSVRATDHSGLATRSETRMIYFVPPMVPPQPPPNDNFQDRVVLQGSSVTARGTTSNATLEPDEPGPGYGSVWWSWTPSQTGYHTLELASTGRSSASVFDGSSLAELKLLGTSSPVPLRFPGNPSLESQLARLTIAVQAGKNYAVSVASESMWEVGPVTLHVFPGVRPEVMLQRVPGTSLHAGDVVELSVQATDLDGQIQALRVSILEPTGNSTLSKEIAASLYRVTITNLLEGNYSVVASATDDSGLDSDVASLDFNVLASPPANAEFSRRTRLEGAPISATGSLVGTQVWCGWTPSVPGDHTVTLTSEAGRYPFIRVYRGSDEGDLQLVAENAFTGIDDESYSTRVTFHAEAGVEYAFSLSAGVFGAGYEVRVNASRPPLARIMKPAAASPIRGAGSFDIVAEASDPEGRLARVDLYVDASMIASFTQPPFTAVVPITQSYWEGRRLRALATDADGLQTWSSSVWAEVYPRPPENDSFSSATVLTGFFTDARGRLGGTTREPGEPIIAPAAENGSAWYAWTAPADGVVMVMLDLEYMTAGVYQGTRVGALTPLVTSGNGTVRQIVARVFGGTTYYLGLEGSARWPNEFELNLLLLPDAHGILTAGVGQDGLFSIGAPGSSAGLHVLEVSTDLRTWMPVQTNAVVADHFRERLDREVPHRFYRVVTYSSP